MSDTVSTSSICFEKNDFNLYLFLLITFIVYLLYIITVINNPVIKKSSNYDSLQKQSTLDTNNALINRINELQNEIKLISNKSTSLQKKDISLQNKFLDKLYNPLSGTSPMNPQGSFANPRGFDGYRQFQQLGYITGPNGRYPIIGRYKFSNNTDKYDLYTIDNDRGRIKIPFKTKNDYLYDGDSIDIPELGGQFTFKKYEDIDGNRYDPNVL
jgi:hypothetical protein